MRNLLTWKICSRKVTKEKQVSMLHTQHIYNIIGFVSPLAFGYILIEECAVPPEEAEKLRTILDPKNTNNIPYGELVKMLKDPNYFAH